VAVSGAFLFNASRTRRTMAAWPLASAPPGGAGGVRIVRGSANCLALRARKVDLEDRKEPGMPGAQSPQTLAEARLVGRWPVPDFSPAALEVLKAGRIVAPDESAADLVERVVPAVFAAETTFGTPATVREALSAEFADLFARKLVTLGSPTLTNAGRYPDSALSSCVAVPVDLREPFGRVRRLIEAYYAQNMGSGFDLSEVDEPVAVLDRLNRHAAQETATGAYDRYIGNMANLDIDHPRVVAFASTKAERRDVRHFNLSLNVTAAFMEALEEERPFPLRDGTAIDPRRLWETIVRSAWWCGDPGLLFLERFNEDNPTPSLGRYTTTAPCAEVALTPGESCVFGYVNLGGLVRHRGGDRSAPPVIDDELLRRVVTVTTRVLDNVLEASLARYPARRSADVMGAKRKIGVGVCGFADLLVALRVPYDSPAAARLLEQVLASISFYSKRASVDLAAHRGSFPEFPRSRHASGGFLRRKYGALQGLHVGPADWDALDEEIRRRSLLRHASTTALPPSGRSALLLDASTSIEPWFSVLGADGAPKPAVRALVEEACLAPSEARATLEAIALAGTCQVPGRVPDAVRRVVKCAAEVAPRDHLAVVAAATRAVDEAASKTINLPRGAGQDVVDDVFRLAWRSGLKAISVYRDGSLEAQPEPLAGAGG
jgi:ribonucleoside-diphosphate reductase alpha chain